MTANSPVWSLSTLSPNSATAVPLRSARGPQETSMCQCLHIVASVGAAFPLPFRGLGAYQFHLDPLLAWHRVHGSAAPLPRGLQDKRLSPRLIYFGCTLEQPES